MYVGKVCQKKYYDKSMKKKSWLFSCFFDKTKNSVFL